MAGKNKNNRRGRGPKGITLLGKKILEVISAEDTPTIIRVEYRGVVTELMKKEIIRNEAGEAVDVLYVGVPKTKNGRPCRYGFSLSIEGGFFSGKGCLNFIVSGGKKMAPRNRTPRKDEVPVPTRNEVDEGRAEFIDAVGYAICHAAFNLNGEPKDGSEVKLPIEQVKELLLRETGFSFTEGEMGYREKNLCGLLGIKAYLVSVASNYNLSIDFTTEDLKKFVRVDPSYAELVSGPWDDVSEDVALTSALEMQKVILIQEAGMRFQKVRLTRDQLRERDNQRAMQRAAMAQQA